MSPASARRKPLHVPTPAQHPVSATDLAAIEASFLGLAHGRVEAVHYVLLFRGKNVVLEFCRNGKYAVFARTGGFSNEDDPVLVLAEQMRAAAGIAPEEPPAGLYGM